MRIEIHPDDRNGVLYQWDIGQRLRLIGVEAGCRVDFIGGSGEPLCVDAYADGDGVFADVPNILLQYAGWVKVLVYVTDAATGETVSEKTLPVLARKKPSEYVYSETEVKTWEDLRKQISSLEKPTAADVSTVFALGNETADNVQRALDLIAAAQEDESQISLLIEEDMLPAVHDADGAILTDESGNVILRY